jgi:hypothetical protein
MNSHPRASLFQNGAREKGSAEEEEDPEGTSVTDEGVEVLGEALAEASVEVEDSDMEAEEARPAAGSEALVVVSGIAAEETRATVLEEALTAEISVENADDFSWVI